MYFRNLFLLFLLFGASFNVAAQSKAANKANKLYKEKQFAAAIPEFEVAIEESPSYGLRSKLAFCYKVTNKLDKAESLYSTLVYDDKVKDVSFKYYAETLIGGGKYAAAKFWLEEYLKKKPDDKQAKVLMETCDLVYTIKPQFPDSEVKPFEFNSEMDDNGAYVVDNRLYFSSDRGGKGKTDVEGRGFMFVYAADNLEGSWQEPSKVGGKINSINSNSGPVSFNGDGSYVVYIKNAPVANKTGQYSLQIYGSSIEDGKIKGSDRLPFCKLESNYYQAAISADGKMIVFSSDKGGGEGKADLYTVKKTGEKWSKPVNLGAKINSPESEGFPHLSADNTLYFCSKGYLGFGGYDVYRSTQNSSGLWTDPVNLGFPINSSGDEMSFFINADNQSGIVSTTRGSGNDDLYFFQTKTEQTIASVDKVETEEPPEFAKAAIAKRKAEEERMKQEKLDRVAAAAEAKRIEKLQAEAAAKAKKEAAMAAVAADNKAKEAAVKAKAPLVDVEAPIINESKEAHTINQKSREAITAEGGDTLYVGKKLDPPAIAVVEKTKVDKKAEKVKKKIKQKEEVLENVPSTKTDETIAAVNPPTKKIDQIEKIREVNDKDINIPSPDPIRMDVPKTPEIEKPTKRTAAEDPPQIEKVVVNSSATKPADKVVVDIKPDAEEKIDIEEATKTATTKEKKKKGKKGLDKVSIVDTPVNAPKVNTPPISKAATNQAKLAAAAAKSKMENKRALENIQTDIKSSATSDKKYTLADLKYGFNATAVSGDLVEPLNSLADLLKAESEIKIKLIGHTGSIGSDEKNQRLSVARAAAAVDYLIQKGIDPNRLSFDGKGETEIINDCHDGVLCGRAQHAENERIELIVQ